MTLADLIADSEDEEFIFHSKEYFQPRKSTSPPQPNPLATTPIMTNDAAASTSKGEARAELEVATKKPRPKPRRKLPTGSIDDAPSAPPSDLTSTTIPVPGNAATTPLPPQDIPLTIADRAKSRVRNAKLRPPPQDIIDIPSDDDEQLLRLSPHRPRRKDAYLANNRSIPDPPQPSIHPSQESLVTPTSDFQPVPVISSQLPPSDPPSSTLPLPTSTPESAKKRKQVPGAKDAGESPSKKRKRAVIEDEGKNQRHVSPHPIIAPTGQPPNFFASSSSSLPPPPAPLLQAESRKRKPTKRNQPVDDAAPSGAADFDPPQEKKSRPQPRKKAPAPLESNEAEQPRPVTAPASRSRPRPNTKEPVYKSAEVIDDSDEEAGSFAPLPPPPRADSQSPLSELSETSDSRKSKPITPGGRRRLIPEVVITTAPKKRTNSHLTRGTEGQKAVEEDGVNGSPKGRKRQKKAVEEDYFDGLDKVELSPKKGPKGKGKAQSKGKSKAKPQAKKVVDEEEFEDGSAEDAPETSKKAKGKAKTKVTAKTKSRRSTKSRVVDSDDEATEDAVVKEPEVAPADGEQAGDSTAQQDAGLDESSPPQGSKEDQENTPPPPNPVKSKSNPPVTPSSVSRKTPVPTSASSFARLNYSHSLASEDKPMTMAEIIMKANSATGTPSGIKSYSSLVKGSRSALRKIAPLHARRKTPPPLPPKPPPPKKTKKQLELEEKWEEELEETIEGWAALSSQERELLRKQKRDMEMGYED